jgi:hypothetical protein
MIGIITKVLMLATGEWQWLQGEWQWLAEWQWF